MARGRRLRKSAGGELEMSKENCTTSNDANLLPNVAVSNEVATEQHIVATAEQNMGATDEVIGEPK